MVNNLLERQDTKKNTKKTLAYLKEAELPWRNRPTKKKEKEWLITFLKDKIQKKIQKKLWLTLKKLNCRDETVLQRKKKRNG
jgi:hypothetical protein